MKVRLGIVSLAGEFEVGFDAASALTAETASALVGQGGEVVDAGVVMCDLSSMERAAEALQGKAFDALLVCVCTWSEDHHLLDLMERLPKLPLILRAYPAFDTGSLCGVQQIGSVFTDIGFEDFHYVYGPPDSPEAAAETLAAAAPAALDAAVRTMRIGTIGGRAAGMTEIAWDELATKAHTGARVVEISEAELAAAVAAVADEAAQTALAEVGGQFPCVTSDAGDVLEAVRYYLAMKALIGRYGLQGLAVNCYTKYMGRVCLGYALLAGEGYACGCEGDVNNTLMMNILQRLTGAPVHNTDLLFPDEAANTILFSHCGSGHPSLAATPQEVCLAPVRLMDTGVCVTFTARPGTVTLADLVGHGGSYRMSVLVGQAVPTGMEFPGNPLKVRFRRPVLEICREVALKGMGHHWMAVYGDVADTLEAYCRRTGIRYSRVE